MDLEEDTKNIPENHDTDYQDNAIFISSSLVMQQVMRALEQVAPTEISVLITGESGTGKELIAKSIHAGSLRKNKPLIVVNCGAIPEGILESELFGHEKGSFTGASSARKGYFELANSGTIFLDEIGEMPLATQVKILRVLENKEFMRVGSAETLKVDVRVIAATNKDLEVEVRNGLFRRDLFFRLNAVNIRVPSLRERKEDIAPFVNYFANEYCKNNHIEFSGFTEQALKTLENYSWPGNVRELKNLVESVIVLEKGRRIDDQILANHLKPASKFDRNLPVPMGRSVEEVEREFIYRALVDLKEEVAEIRRMLFDQYMPARKLAPWDEIEPGFEPSLEVTNHYQREHPNGQSVDEMQKQLIINTLQSTSGNRRKTAKILGISERTLYRKIKQYGL